MSPSRPFILRPVATSLLMAAILLVGIVAYHAAAGFGAAGSRLPDDPGAHLLSRRQPGRHGHHRHCAAGTPVRRDAGPEPDDLDQRRRRLGHRAAVQPLARRSTSPKKKCSRRSTAARPFCRPICPSRRSTTRPIPPTRRSSRWPSPPTLMPLSQVEDLVDTRLAPKLSQLAGVGLVSISGGQKPAVRIQVNPVALSSYGLNMEDVRTALDAGQRQLRQGQLRRPAPGLPDRRQRPDHRGRANTRTSSSPTATARRSSSKMSPTSSMAWRTPSRPRG